MEVPKVARPGLKDRQNLRLLCVTWLIPSAIKNSLKPLKWCRNEMKSTPFESSPPKPMKRKFIVSWLEQQGKSIGLKNKEYLFAWEASFFLRSFYSNDGFQ